MLNRTKTYTLNEFLEKSRENEVTKLEKLLILAKSNKKLKTAILIFTANIFYIQKKLDEAVICATTGDPLDKLNIIGIKFLGIAQTFGYWICIIMCVVDIIKSLMNGDAKGAGKIFIRYLMAFIALYGVKFMFDQVKFVFAQ